MTEKSEKPPLEFDKAWEPPKTNVERTPWRFFVFKLFAALAVLVLVVLGGMIVGIRSLRQSSSWVCLPQTQTMRDMHLLSSTIQKIKEETGAVPESLEKIYEADVKNPNEYPFERWLRFRAGDGWEHPLIYTTDGKTWELLSHGADGKPGGIGLNADIRWTPTDSWPRYDDTHTPTVRQVMASSHFSSTIFFSALFGVIMAIAFLKEVVKIRNTMENVVGIVVAAIIMAAVSLVPISALIAVQSIASGH